MSLILLLASPALATDVVWVEPVDDAMRIRVAQQAGATTSLEPLDLRAAATAFDDDDAGALRDLGATLEDVRRFETELDGELIIMRDLQQAVERVRILRDEADRSTLFSALAYQGFAVNRFFADGLADAEEAEPYRATFEGLVVERPWLDAIAIEPERDVTAYEIAEAPQRVVYDARKTALSELLPASLIVTDLPQGARLVVDGRKVQPGPSGGVKVRPGRHIAHAELDGRVVARWDVRVAPAEASTLRVELTDAIWTGFLASAAPGGSLPAPVVDAVEALGGEVWLAWPGEGTPRVLSVSASGIESVTVAQPQDAVTDDPESDGMRVEAVAGVVGGWFTSGDFYTQDPGVAPRTASTVNSGAVGVSVGFQAAVGPLRAGAGADVLVPMGEFAVALSGESAYRARPVPFVAAGLPWVQAAFGYVFPYHPAVGGRVALPLLGPVELQGLAWYGLQTSRTRADGTPWDSLAIGTVAGGLGVRL